MEEIHMNGRVRPMASNGYSVSLLCKSLLLKNGAIRNSSSINIILNINAKGIIGRITFWLFNFCSLTNFDMAVGNPSEQSVMKRLNVGSIRE